MSATEEHSQANANRSRESAIANIKRLCDLRDASAHKPVVNAAISMALGCSITGDVDPNEVIRIAEKLYEAGVDMVAVADTVGYAGPKQVGDLTRAVVKIAGNKPVCVHLHDTRGMGIANASAALDAGARVLDGSLGGLGGCPFAPGATGNVVFEDLVFLCESKGFPTGIDLREADRGARDPARGNAGRSALWRSWRGRGCPAAPPRRRPDQVWVRAVASDCRSYHAGAWQCVGHVCGYFLPPHRLPSARFRQPRTKSPCRTRIFRR